MTKPMRLNADYLPPATATAAKQSLWSRFTRSLFLTRQRSVEREIGRFIEMNGGELTDDLERQISRRFGGPAGRA